MSHPRTLLLHAEMPRHTKQRSWPSDDDRNQSHPEEHGRTVFKKTCACSSFNERRKFTLSALKRPGRSAKSGRPLLRSQFNQLKNFLISNGYSNGQFSIWFLLTTTLFIYCNAFPPCSEPEQKWMLLLTFSGENNCWSYFQRE